MNLLKNILFVGIFCSIMPNFTHQLSVQEVSSCYDVQNNSTEAWKYLEFVFITKSNNGIDAGYNGTLINAGITLSLMCILSKLTLAKDSFVNESSNQIMLGLLSGALINKYMQAQASMSKKAILVDFIKNWNLHKPHIPTEVHAMFDAVSEEYENKGEVVFTDQLVSQIFDIVAHLVEHSFEKRYPKDKKSGDIVGMVKTLSDIGKNILPSSK